MPKARLARSSPNLPKCLIRSSLDHLVISPIVRIPNPAKRAEVFGPIPHKAFVGKGAKNSASLPGGTTVIAQGGEADRLEAFPTSVAIFATSLFVDTPIEHGSLNLSWIYLCIDCASDSLFSGTSLKSRKASSMDTC